MGVQVTAGPHVNSGLQPPTRWEPFVAGTMLRRSEPTKETFEPMILCIIATVITHLTRFTLLLLLRIQRYMWRNHVATEALDDNSGKNLDLNKIRFPFLHVFSNIVFGLDLNLKKWNHLTGIWKRRKSQYETHCRDHNIQILH